MPLTLSPTPGALKKLTRAARLQEQLTLGCKTDLHDWSVECGDGTETQEALAAVLSEWIDLMFVPAPASFMMYADHDEYATFFARRKSHLTHIEQAFSTLGIAPVKNYRRWDRR